MAFEKVKPCEITRTALIVEDNEMVRDLLAIALQMNGYETILMTTAEQALATVRGILVDVMLIDYMLPGMNGVELVKEMERIKKRHAPVIIVSAHQDAYERSQEINPEGIIRKPFGDLQEMLAMIDEIVERYQEARRIEQLL